LSERPSAQTRIGIQGRDDVWTPVFTGVTTFLRNRPYQNMKDLILKIYLQPRSSKNEIVGPYRDGIKVKVTAPPIEGKANEALIRFLAKEFGISASCIEMIKGRHSREKTLRILGPKNRMTFFPFS